MAEKGICEVLRREKMILGKGLSPEQPKALKDVGKEGPQNKPPSPRMCEFRRRPFGRPAFLY